MDIKMDLKQNLVIIQVDGQRGSEKKAVTARKHPTPYLRS